MKRDICNDMYQLTKKIKVPNTEERHAKPANMCFSLLDIKMRNISSDSRVKRYSPDSFGGDSTDSRKNQKCSTFVVALLTAVALPSCTAVHVRIDPFSFSADPCAEILLGQNSIISTCPS
jgi:hypothetical protein